MKKESDTVLRVLSACGLAIALLASSPVVLAEGTVAASAITTTAPENAQASTTLPVNDAAQVQEEPAYVPLQVGDATQGLLAWQRSGDVASKTPRPIAGAVAQRSHERYLKSFEFPIPERMSSSVKTSTGGNGASAR